MRIILQIIGAGTLAISLLFGLNYLLKPQVIHEKATVQEWTSWNGTYGVLVFKDGENKYKMQLRNPDRIVLEYGNLVNVYESPFMYSVKLHGK